MCVQIFVGGVQASATTLKILLSELFPTATKPFDISMTTTFWEPNERIAFVPVKRELPDNKRCRMKYKESERELRKHLLWVTVGGVDDHLYSFLSCSPFMSFAS